MDQPLLALGEGEVVEVLAAEVGVRAEVGQEAAAVWVGVVEVAVEVAAAVKVPVAVGAAAAAKAGVVEVELVAGAVLLRWCCGGLDWVGCKHPSRAVGWQCRWGLWGSGGGVGCLEGHCNH